MIDHPSQLQASHEFYKTASFPLQVFVKIDTGYHRAGVGAETKELDRLLEAISTFESMGFIELIGFYSHGGHSYAGKDSFSFQFGRQPLSLHPRSADFFWSISIGDSESGAMKVLVDELTGLEKASNRAQSTLKHNRLQHTDRRKLTLSVGSTPTTVVIENFLSPEPPQGRNLTVAGLIDKIRSLTKKLQEKHDVEFHAGVYPLLDLQQLATQVGPSKVSTNSYGHPRRNTAADIGFTILAEVSSVYEDRKPPEALVAAGTFALGREPCKAYPGWGIVGEWGLSRSDSSETSRETRSEAPATVHDGRSGWQVGRISQEHGILTKDPQAHRSPVRLHVGQKVRIWPNHACVAGAGFPWYVVVDSSRVGKEDEIVDIWVRCRGW